MHAVDGVSLHARGGRGARHRRRIRLGQERHHAGADGADRLSRAGCSADKLRFAGHDLLDLVRPRAARAHRQGRRDDLPGADDQPQPLLHHRLPARWRRCACTEGWTRRRRSGARSSCWSRSAFPRRESRLHGLSAPAVRRHEPARDDRDGDRLQSAPADRRRADHRARRHHPGADPRPAAQPAARARHGAGADHPQHGRGRARWRSASP